MKKLLIPIDLLNDFCDQKGALAKSIITGKYYGIDVVMHAAGVVDSFRADGSSIIWLGDWHKKDDKEFDRFPAHAIMNTWGAQIVEDLIPDMVESFPNELKINKTRYNGFYGTYLEYQLARLAPEEIHVIGVCTSICVMDTVGGLANRDYKVVVHKDSVGDFDPAAHDFALNRMETLYGAKIV